jgi:hypothetical protein
MVLLMAVLLNLVLIGLFYFGMKVLTDIPTKMVMMHYAFKWTSIGCLIVTLPLFMLASMRDPGYLKNHYPFLQLINKALDEGIELNAFCSYCEVIKTQTSFHCQQC